MAGVCRVGQGIAIREDRDRPRCEVEKRVAVEFRVADVLVPPRVRDGREHVGRHLLRHLRRTGAPPVQRQRPAGGVLQIVEPHRIHAPRFQPHGPGLGERPSAVPVVEDFGIADREPDAVVGVGEKGVGVGGVHEQAGKKCGTVVDVCTRDSRRGRVGQMTLHARKHRRDGAGRRIIGRIPALRTGSGEVGGRIRNADRRTGPQQRIRRRDEFPLRYGHGGGGVAVPDAGRGGFIGKGGGGEAAGQRRDRAVRPRA